MVLLPALVLQLEETVWRVSLSKRAGLRARLRSSLLKPQVHKRRVDVSEPVWPSGKALGWEAEGPRFDPLRLSFLFSSKMVVYGHCLVTLPTQ